MDQEEIAKRVQSLKISNSSREEPVIIPEVMTSQGLQRLDLCLVGKVFSSKAVNRETFRTQMPRILQAKKQIKSELVGENMFMLEFASSVDRRHALIDGPWTFFQDLVIFKAPMGLQLVSEMSFDEISIWVQCYNVPIAFMQSDILYNIGSKIGKVLEVEAGEDGKCEGRYARIRVLLDISKPLQQGIWVRPENSKEELCIVLLYERLPNFCFVCGKLGHLKRECEDKGLVDSEVRFGNWLRAFNRVVDRKSAGSKSKQSHNSDILSSEQDFHEEEGLHIMTLEGKSSEIKKAPELLRQQSESEDNIINKDDDHYLLGKMNEEDQSDKVGLIMRNDISSLSEMNIMINPNKKKWKRLARANDSISKDKEAEFGVLAQGKRQVSDEIEFSESIKKPRNDLEDNAKKIIMMAEVAMQPRQTP